MTVHPSPRTIIASSVSSHDSVAVARSFVARRRDAAIGECHQRIVGGRGQIMLQSSFRFFVHRTFIRFSRGTALCFVPVSQLRSGMTSANHSARRLGVTAAISIPSLTSRAAIFSSNHVAEASSSDASPIK